MSGVAIRAIIPLANIAYAETLAEIARNFIIF